MKKEFKSNYIFKGKNIFFPNVEFNILNTFIIIYALINVFQKIKIILKTKR